MTSEEWLIYIGAFGLALLILFIRRVHKHLANDNRNEFDRVDEGQINRIAVEHDDPDPDPTFTLFGKEITISQKPNGIIGIGILVGAVIGGTFYSVPLFFFRLFACGYPEAPIQIFFPVGAILGAVCVLAISLLFVSRSAEKKKAAVMGVLRGCVVVIVICLGCGAFSSIPDCTAPPG